MRSINRTVLGVALASVLGIASIAHATTAQQKCALALHKAVGKYAKCHQIALAREVLGGYDTQKEMEKCVTKYVATWPKLQAKYIGTGATCELARYVDNGDGTVTDRLTALRWEKKDGDDGVQAPADPHDVDNLYAWSSGGTNADGAAFTTFLAALNTPTCFAAQCDWRMPTLGELYTIALTDINCSEDSCVDAALAPNGFASWTSTWRFTGPWLLGFNGSAYLASGIAPNSWPVRAVRAGFEAVTSP